MSLPGQAGAGRRPSKSNAPLNLSLDVAIDGHYNSKVYTSGSSITGHVTIEPTQDVEFDSVDVSLTGTASTTIDLNRQFPTTNSRPFMTLSMPVPNGALPDTQALIAGTKYTIPFDFTFPTQLSISACTHSCPDPVREQHLKPPPTMGIGSWEGNDGCPRGASIEYAIKTVVVLRARDGLGREKRQIKNEYVLKALPAAWEDAPLDITRQDEGYALTKSLTLRKKSLGFGKVGEIRATAAQPSAVMLNPDGRHASSSSVRISLEFIPASTTDISLPKLGAVMGKLQSDTVYSVRPMDHLPNLGSRANIGTDKCRAHTTTSTLFSAPAGEVEWKKSLDGNHEAAESSVSEQSEPWRQPTYSTVLEIPFSITISRDRVLLPSFDNCLISRAYSIHLKVTAGPNNATLGLSVPLQVGVATTLGSTGAEAPPTFESAVSGVDDQLLQSITSATVLTRRDNVLPSYTARS